MRLLQKATLVMPWVFSTIVAFIKNEAFGVWRAPFLYKDYNAKRKQAKA